MELKQIMGEQLGIDPQYISICSKRNNLYVKYFIKKKNGGLREIFHPSKELKVLQHWLVRNIYSKFPISEYSKAYSKGCSIKNNAQVHSEGTYVLHTDIKDFFPSINRDMMIDFFKRKKAIVRDLQLDEQDISLMLDISLYQGKRLVIGAVSSPIISNIYMYDFDKELFEILSKRMKCRYTRYADDIVISSKEHIDKEIIGIIDDLMNKYGFTMNYKKTYFMNKKMRRQITGVVLDNNANRISIGNKKYKEFERDLYNYLIKRRGELGHLQGYLAYINDVNAKQYEQLRKIYARYDKRHELFNITDL